MKRDPRLARIAEWCNKATPEESAWLPFFWRWVSLRILKHLEDVEAEEMQLMNDLHSGEVLDDIAGEWPPLDSETDIGEIDPATRNVRQMQKRLRIVGPAMIDGVPLDPPPLAERSRRKLCDVLCEIFLLWKESHELVRKNLRRNLDDSPGPDFFPDNDGSPEVNDLLREEGLLDKYLSHPRLKRCPVCKEWFAASKTDQKYCTSDRYPPCREIASRGKPGEDSDRRTRYLESQSHKMELRRKAVKEAKEREAEKRRKKTLRDIRKQKKLFRRVKKQ